MSRDMRVEDNWALIYAVEEAERTDSPIGVAFNLVDHFMGGCARQFGFMLRGLQKIEPKFKALNIPFFFLHGHPKDTISDLVRRSDARLLVMDYSPLRIGIEWKRAVMERVDCVMEEVDAHNIVPVWVASDKKEFAARTIRPKINSKLNDYLTDFPPLKPIEKNPWPEMCLPEEIPWETHLETVLERGKDVPEVDWIVPGEDAAREALSYFLEKERLGIYAAKRNDPTANGQSGLSPYFHFGFLSAQRAAFEVQKLRHRYKESVDGFLEESIIRRELSDNFCHFEPKYDSLEAAASWAKQTLDEHRKDRRPYIYTKSNTLVPFGTTDFSREQFERAETHEDLWNACQKELIYVGKLHGYMRMYWAKMILEWTETPEEALEISIYLNDKFSLDGRDPNGFVGCQWSVAGIHDRAFKERDIIGKIRPMTYGGCKRKFDIAAYIARMEEAERRFKQTS